MIPMWLDGEIRDRNDDIAVACSFLLWGHEVGLPKHPRSLVLEGL